MKKISRRRFFVLLLWALCTTALAQRDTLTMRIPTAIAAGEYAEAKMLIEEAIKTGVITAAAAAEYQRQIQAQERSAASKPNSKSRPSPEDRLGPDGIPLHRPVQEPDESKKRLGRVYVTYTKLNKETGRYYSGRTSMVIDLGKDIYAQAEEAILQRDVNHHVEDESPEPKDPAFGPARYDRHDWGMAVDYNLRYDDKAYLRIRGREQMLIDSFGGAWSDTGKPYKTENRIRGVAKESRDGRRFYEAAKDYWGNKFGDKEVKYTGWY